MKSQTKKQKKLVELLGEDEEEEDIYDNVEEENMEDGNIETNNTDYNNIMDNFQEFSVADDVPDTDNWVMNKIYINSGDRIRFWQCGFDSTTNEVVVFHGFLDSANIVSSRTEITAKVNRNIQEQALLEIKSKYNEKYFQGYCNTPGDYITDEECNFQQPMLANTYEPVSVSEKTGKPTKGNVPNFPVSTQAKFDGSRLLAKFCKSEVVFRTRELRTINNFANLREEIKHLFKYLPKNSMIDGEQYNPDIHFDKLRSIVATKNTRHPDEDIIKYYIFDIYTSEPMIFEHRRELINNAYKKYLADGYKNNQFVIVPDNFANNHEELISQLDFYISKGFEGIMIRHLGLSKTKKQDIERSYYKVKRSNNLLKLKRNDEEEIIIEGVQKDIKGMALFSGHELEGKKLYLPSIKPSGTNEERKEWADNPEKVIGKKYTIKFWGRTGKGMPKFPVGKTFRDYE